MWFCTIERLGVYKLSNLRYGPWELRGTSLVELFRAAAIKQLQTKNLDPRTDHLRHCNSSINGIGAVTVGTAAAVRNRAETHLSALKKQLETKREEFVFLLR